MEDKDEDEEDEARTVAVLLVSGSVAASSSVRETRNVPTSTVLYKGRYADDDDDDDDDEDADAAEGEISAAGPALAEAELAVISSVCFLGGCRCCVVSGSDSRSTDGNVARSLSSGASEAAHRPSSSGGVEDAESEANAAESGMEPVAWW